MKRKSIIFWLFVGFFLILFHPNVGAIQEDKELDKIENMVVTVEPCMKDASLDITYEITWKVLDSITGGPLTLGTNWNTQCKIYETNSLNR